jgi:hypothetical protein
MMHAVVSAILGLAFPIAIQAQVTLGSITGSVKDSTGAVVPGVAVTVTGQQTGISSSASTQADGVYLIRGLVPGFYIVTVEALLAKNFYVKENWRAQLRWEMFNMSNTPVWGLPATSLLGPNFGIITTASSRRIMQFGLKIYR